MRRAGRSLLAQDYLGVLIATVALILLIGAFYPRFLQFDQLMAILQQATTIGILACGMAFLLAMRELDLSVGSVYALTALACAELVQHGFNPWLSAVLAIVVGGLLGLFNSLLIQYFGLPSIVATLATLALFRGLTLALSDGKQVLGPPVDDPFSTIIGGTVLGVPVTGIVLVVVVAVLTVVLRATAFGYRVRSIGSNPDAAEFSGIPVNRVRMQAFVLSGALGGLAGVLTIGYLGAADPNTGTGYELMAIAAAVIGGTSLAGGRATIVGAALGAILLGVVASGLGLLQRPDQLEPVRDRRGDPRRRLPRQPRPASPACTRRKRRASLGGASGHRTPSSSVAWPGSRSRASPPCPINRAPPRRNIVRTRSTMTVRRTATALVAGSMVMLVAACGSSSGGGDTASGKKASDLKIAFIAADGSQNFAQEMMAGATAAGKEAGVNVQVLAPTKLDGPAEVKMFEDAMRTAPDGIGIMTLTPDLLTRSESRAVAQKIPVLAVDVPPLPGSNVTSYIGNDNVAAGKMLADAAIEKIKAAGKTTGKAVVASPIPGVPTLDNRAKGMAQAFTTGLPSFKVVGPVASSPDPTGNFSAWSNLVAANSDASAFMDAGDAANASLAKINRAAGNKYLTGAFDLNAAGLQAVKDGVNFACVDPEHFLKGYLATRILIDNALGKKAMFKGWWVNPAELVTKTNVDEIVTRQASTDAKLAWFKSKIDEAMANPPIKQLSEAN